MASTSGRCWPTCAHVFAYGAGGRLDHLHGSVERRGSGGRDRTDPTSASAGDRREPSTILSCVQAQVRGRPDARVRGWPRLLGAPSVATSQAGAGTWLLAPKGGLMASVERRGSGWRAWWRDPSGRTFDEAVPEEGAGRAAPREGSARHADRGLRVRERRQDHAEGLRRRAPRPAAVAGTYQGDRGEQPSACPRQAGRPLDRKHPPERRPGDDLGAQAGTVDCEGREPAPTSGPPCCRTRRLDRQGPQRRPPAAEASGWRGCTSERRGGGAAVRLGQRPLPCRLLLELRSACASPRRAGSPSTGSTSCAVRCASIASGPTPRLGPAEDDRLEPCGARGNAGGRAPGAAPRALRAGEEGALVHRKWSKRLAGPMGVNVWAYEMRKTAAAAGLPGTRFHDLRHHAASRG